MAHSTIGIVGGESLLGKEIREVLRSRSVAAHVRLIGSDEEETGKLTAEGDEPAVITALDRTNLASADVVVLAGSEASSRKAWEIAGGSAPPFLIDAAGVLEDIPQAKLTAPLVDGGVHLTSPSVIANPAAAALAFLLRRLPAYTRAVVDIFEPASTLGQTGIDELHQQTIRLFSFQPLPKQVYDTQIAFAMLPRLGLDAPYSLQALESRIDRHLATLLEGVRTMPSLRLVQAPVFHGYSMSLWIEFEGAVAPGEIETALSSNLIELAGPGEEAPSNVSAAGQSGIAVGNIRPDRNCPRAYWIWLVADNLRLTADNVADAVEQVLP
jgi:aspartate-semialdehyde dehydrogenase